MHLSVTERKRPKEKINKHTEDFNNTISLNALIYMHRTLHPAIANYKFVSNAHGLFTKLDYMLSLRRSLNKFEKAESYKV